MSSAFNDFSSPSSATQYQHDYRQRIPQQQGVGQTLPPNAVGSIPHNTPPPPPGAMPPGTQVVVGQHKVVIQVYLAEGGFAHVYLVRMKDFSDPIVLKRIAVPDTERLKSVEKEIVFMRRLGNHKNIVRYFDSQVSPLPTGGFEALILMEYCPGGGVIDLMNRRLQQRLTEPEILKIFGDVSEALAYMHYCNPAALHRDLKVENILISASGRYKLCDFGSACLSKGQYIPKSLPEIQKLEDDIQRHTTLQYRAPEMIDIYQKRPINEKADIWALGVLLYKLCYYTTPFEEQGPLAILSAKFTFPHYPQFSDKTRNLISWLLTEDQERRPNIYQVVETVCKLRGKECPIRNIYANNSVASSPKSQTTEQSKSASDRRGTDTIFEQRVQPKQQTPNITPMRRGRPERKDKENQDPISKDEKMSNDKFDPFDPNASSPSQRKQTILDFDPATVFSLNEKTSFTSKSASSDSETKYNQSRSDKLATTSAQSHPSRFSPSPVGGQSPSGSFKANQFQHAAGSSTPDSFKSPSLNPRIQQLTGESKLLPATPSGGQSISPARTPSPAAQDANANVTGERETQSVTPSDILKNSKFESSTTSSLPVWKLDVSQRVASQQPYNVGTSSTKNESDKSGTARGVSNQFTETKGPDAKAYQFASNTKNITQAPPRSTSMQASHQSVNATHAPKASFDKISPNFISAKGDSVEDFNLKFPDLSSLDQHFSGASGSSRKNDYSAAFTALDKFDSKTDDQHGSKSKSSRHSVFDRFSSPTDETKPSPNRRSSMNSADMNSKGNQIQSKVKEQLHRFEMANNERKAAELRSQRALAKTSTSTPKSETGDVKPQENKFTLSTATEWHSPSHQRESSSSSQATSAKEPSSELAEMKKSLQTYRQMLQSPSPSPKDDTETFDFANVKADTKRISSPTKVSSKSPESSSTTLIDATPSRSSTKSPQDIASQASDKKENASFTKSSSPSPKSVPATHSGPYRPTPPPKPARFRMSSTMVPVLTPSNASSKSEVPTNPRNLVGNSQHVPRTKLTREPSITEFESKFPSPEQLQEGLPNGS
ncbi:Ark- serine/threonine protein kinase [Umbelopsis sp. WA50703]